MADRSFFTYLIAGYSKERGTIKKEYLIIQYQQRIWSELMYVADEREFYVKLEQLDTVYWHDDCNGIM